MVIYIDGPINAGKTTVGRMLAGHLPNAVHIEVDHLRHFASCLALEEAIPFALEDTLSLTGNWIRRGYDVVVTWPIDARNHVRFAEAIAGLGVSLVTFTLLPRREIALKNRGKRVLTDGEKRRIGEMYETMYADGGVGVLIDNSQLSLEETVQRILHYLSDKKDLGSF